ncbi:bifunctional protein TilS/HprT [biofilm metagenome]
MQKNLARLKLELNARIIRPAQINMCSRIVIAYSGGLDSHVLLHLCASGKQIKNKLTAVYINHGLQKEANAWAKHCESICHELGVKFQAINVNAVAAPGESPEEAARNARYAALMPLLGKDDALLVAQHVDDQLETVLLQLFRGSGLKGLSGMPSSMPFGSGLLIRPLLDVSKDDIIRYANDHALNWINDPSNQHTAFDRNYLRHDILPLIKKRWPSIDLTVSRSATHCAEAQTIISTLADELLASAMHTDKTLDINALHNQSASYQALIIRQWFQVLGLKMPGQRIVKQILEQVITAKTDANPIVATQGHQIRRYRQRLYCIKPQQIITMMDGVLTCDQMSFSVTDNIRYEVMPSTDGINVEQWNNARITINFRSGGESICLPGRTGTHSLRKLFQEAGVPPWERGLIPLVYLDGKLAAVGELWIAAGFFSKANGCCVRLNKRELTVKGNDGTANID